MYCRECGIQLNNEAKFCHACGSDVVIFQQEVIKEEPAPPKASKVIPNPYTNISALLAAVGLILSLFPWPREWGVGTSTWMIAVILVIGLVAYALYRKAHQFNQQLLAEYVDVSKNGRIKFAKLSSTLTIILATITLVSKMNFF